MVQHEFLLENTVPPNLTNHVVYIFRESLESCDLLVTTGGVSMGDRDLLRKVLSHIVKYFQA